MPVPCSSSSGWMARTPVGEKNTMNTKVAIEAAATPIGNRYRFEVLVRSGRSDTVRATSARVPPSFQRRSAASAGNGVHTSESAHHPSSAMPLHPGTDINIDRSRRRTSTCGSNIPPIRSRPAPTGMSVNKARRERMTLTGTRMASSARPTLTRKSPASAAGSSLTLRVGADIRAVERS